MFYSEDFKARCKKVYPTFERLHKALDENSEWVGTYLKDSADEKISVDIILKATSLEEVQALARVAKEKCSLYVEWRNLSIYQRENKEEDVF